MRTSSWIAIALAVATTGWLASGYLTGNQQAEDAIEAGASSPQAALVEVETCTAQEIPVFLYAQGETRPFRSANAVVQTSGSIGRVYVQQGDQVEAGAVLATIRPAALLSRREGAQAQVDRLEADLEGVRSLTHQGVVPETRRRELEAQLAQARAELASIDEQIDNATIRAPVGGNVNEVFVNAGQFAQPGTDVAAIVDNAPFRVTFQIAQQDFGRLSTGSIVLADFATGHVAKGRVCFVARTADPETRTFRAEARIVNEDAAIPSYISAELRTETAAVKAHFVSPAIFSLNDEGVLGIKTVDDDNRVEFQTADIVRTENEGVWVTGLPDQIRVISVGQGFVRDGEDVRVVEQGDEAVARSPSGEAPLPTASVRSDPFGDAAALPDPPTEEVLCSSRGASLDSGETAVSVSQDESGSTSSSSGASSSAAEVSEP